MTIIDEQFNLPIHRRKVIHSVSDKSVKENIAQYLHGRDDDFSLSILERIQYVPDLVAAGARYHHECATRVYAPPAKGSQKGRPTGKKVDDAMKGTYSFLTENSNECQFSMDELMEQIKGDFITDIRTVKKHLQTKYGDDIIINNKQGPDCVICFRNTGYKILSEKWYEEKNKDYRQEKLRVIREAAANIREGGH